MTRRSNGFTLIELAIALTVIALLMAGVLMGSNVLIEKSRVASLLAKIKDLGAASRDFKSRYGYFPGDLPNAGSYITGTAYGALTPGCTGNGDGLINTAESICATEELVKSGLLTKADQDSAGYFIGSGFEGGGRVSLSHNTATNENVISVALLPCNVALELDRKLDSDYLKSDGVTPAPLSMGTVVGWDVSGSLIDTCTPGAINDPLPTLLVKY